MPIESEMNLNEEIEPNQVEPIYKGNQQKEEDDELYFQKVSEEKMEKEIKHASRPLWISTIIVKYPIIMLLVTALVYISFSVIVFSTDAAQIQRNYYRDFLVWGDTIVNQYDSMELSAEDLNENYPNGEQPLRTTRKSIFSTQILFECNDCNTILTVDNVKQMYEVEQIMVNDPNYVNF